MNHQQQAKQTRINSTAVLVLGLLVMLAVVVIVGVVVHDVFAALSAALDASTSGG